MSWTFRAAGRGAAARLWAAEADARPAPATATQACIVLVAGRKLVFRAECGGLQARAARGVQQADG
jgi:hypothetical protein